MTKTINSDLIRGNINTIILKALYSGDRYGYDIIKEIEDKSHGQYIRNQPQPVLQAIYISKPLLSFELPCKLRLRTLYRTCG